MVKTEQITIGDHEYSVRQWSATRAMVMKIKVLKYIGKFLGVLGENDFKDIQKTLMANLGDILEDVDEVKFVNLIKEVACSAARDGERMVLARFDEYFLDDFMQAYELAFFVIKVNYEDFLGSVLSLNKGK